MTCKENMTLNKIQINNNMCTYKILSLYSSIVPPLFFFGVVKQSRPVEYLSVSC